MSSGELAGSLGMKVAMQRLDELMLQKGVSAETRAMIINSTEMMYEYIPYALQQGKAPSDGKVLAEFLAKKGSKLAKYLGADAASCGAALVEFCLSLRQAATVSSTGFPPAVTLAWGLALLDLIEVGNSCEFAQRAYYEAFLRESAVKLEPLRQEARMTPLR